MDREYYQRTIDTRFKTSEDSAEKVSIDVSNDQERYTLTQAQKYQKIKYLLELWQKEEEVCIEAVKKRNETEFMYDDGDDTVYGDSIDTVDITAKVKVENDNSIPQHLSPNDFDTTEFSTKLNNNDHKCNPLKNIKMPEQMKKRGRPKGAEVTVAGLPRKKAKTNDKVTVESLNA